MKTFQFIQNNHKPLAAIIIVISTLLAIASARDDTPIVDEIPHIGSGYSYIEKGDFRLNPEHPPLAKSLAGLGAEIASEEDNISFTTRFWTTDVNGQWEFGRYFIFNSGNDTDKIIFYSKLPMLLFFIFSGVVIFKLANKLHGPTAALLALFLFSFSPTVLAHSRFVTTDVPALFGVLLASYFFFKYLQEPSRKNLMWAGLAFGIAQLCKYSLFLLNPYFLVVGFAYGFIQINRGFGKKIKNGLHYLFNTVVIIIIGYIFVWMVYVPHTINYPPELQKIHTTQLLSTYGNRLFADTVIYFSDKPIIRAFSQYSLGMLMVVQRSLGGNDTYFLGEFSNHAWKHYFPVVYLIKEPLTFWILVVITFLYFPAQARFNFSGGLKKNIGRLWNIIIDWIRNHFIEFAMWLWLAVYWYTSIRANLNIGVRHLMPVYGFTYILLAGKVARMTKEIKTKQFSMGTGILMMLLLGWYLVENIRIYPYYLTYFNQLVGGPSNGFKYVVDSNIDWGQDLKRLSQWVEENNIEKIHLDYFGWSDQAYYLNDHFIWLQSHQYRSIKEFLAVNREGGYIAVSASFYMGLSQQPGRDYNWLDLEDRIATIGNSIFVWHIQPR